MKLKAASLRSLNEEKNDLELVACHLLGKKALNEDRSVPEVLEGKPVLIIGAQGDPNPIRVRKTSRDLPFFYIIDPKINQFTCIFPTEIERLKILNLFS